METKTTILTNTTTTASAFKQMVERLYAEKSATVGNQGTLASIIATCFASMSQVQNPWKRAAFRDLLLHLEAQGCYALLRNELYINALANIAAFGNKMVRDSITWEKESFVAENQMSSLIQNCFAKYEVPEFLESVFYGQNKIQMLWYVQLGRGDSVLNLSSFPIHLTKKMAHEFKNAPVNYSVEQAIRYIQAKGFGATETMAETLAWSVLSESFGQEVFWEKVVVFFAKYEELPFAKVQEVLFFIKEQFGENKNFSMKGRTWEALVRNSDEWHSEYFKKMNALNRAQWTTSGINGFEKHTLKDNENSLYYIVELVNSEELYEEGYEMSHCVAEYEYVCIEGRTAIFSLREKQQQTDYATLATIEVDLADRAVVQAKARYNEYVSFEAYEIIVEWAEKESIILCFEYEDAADQAQYQMPIENQYIVQDRYVAPRYEYNEEYNRRDTTFFDNEINWKWILYVIFLLIKVCMLLGR
ncbi:PcfJ domain-containing protein [Flavobacterium sp.]|uniref:PcfJ domain-containing protein n=1 Tax=Flavobacterium sp. TaxID=239 RepID=UPI003D6A2342